MFLLAEQERVKRELDSKLAVGEAERMLQLRKVYVAVCVCVCLVGVCCVSCGRVVSMDYVVISTVISLNI